ncbi:MAG: radical SAM/SPASM domain-containing protein [Nitrospinales bacterium]
MSNSLFKKSLSAFKALLTQKVYMECDRIPFEFDRVPLRKILNWILVETACILKPEKPWGFPTHLQIEPTNLCNLRCALCYVTKGLDRAQGHMDLDLFKKLIDEIGDYVFLILFWGWGEPFLNPSAYDMIAYANQKGIKIVSSTNGHVFAEDDHAEKLVRSGLDALIFAIDGISQETYKQYRKRGDLAKVIKGLKKVVSARDRLQSITPMINLRFIVMKHNEHEVPQLKEFAELLGADLITLKTLNPHDGLNVIGKTGPEAEFLPQNPNYQRFRLDPITHKPVRRTHNPCKDLWNYSAMNRDGKIVMCCEDYSEKTLLGDLKTETFKDVWFGHNYRELRHKFRDDYRTISLCAQCSSAFEGGALGTELIADSHFLNVRKRF